MRPKIALLAAIAVFAVGSAIYADYAVAKKGEWPASWPKELEPLRKQSRTLEGPLVPRLHYEIPFTKREEFESAWPHLLKVKSRGAPVILLRGPDTWLGNKIAAGVRIHCPPGQTDKRANPEQPLTGQGGVRQRWMWTNYIELIVDGEIVVLNRIPLPADTPIVDERFQDGEHKSLTDKRAAASQDQLTLMGALAEWMYPGSSFGGASMSDGGDRTVQSVNCQARLTTGDPFEKVTKFYEQKFLSGPMDVGAVVTGGQPQSVSSHDDSSKRPVHLRVIHVNRAKTCTTLVISRVDGESQTHIAWSQFVRLGVDR
jgi:hypothetical protein